MTREEAIRRLRYIRMDYLGYPPFLEPIDMAIEALKADAVQIHDDGTLEVKVPNAQKVGRVLVMDTDSHIGGGLFYPADAVQGEWQKVEEQPYFRKHYDTVCCSVCRKKGNRKWNFCPNCGAIMENKE